MWKSTREFGSIRCCVISTVIGTGLCLILAGSIPQTVGAASLKQGSSGSGVVELQRSLTKLGFFSGPTNGRFGPVTKAALLSFQKSVGLSADGIAGAGTLSAIGKALAPKDVFYIVSSGDSLWTIAKRYGITVDALVAVNSITEDAKLDIGDRLKVPSSKFTASRGIIRDTNSVVSAIPWSSVTTMFTGAATVTDVKTKMTFSVRRRGGTLHADVEPATQADTETLRRIYGGSWSWSRRAVIVRIGSHAIAGSINGMPHGGEKVTGNGFNGHFCLHFLGSRIHKTGAVDPDHQAMIRLAVRQ